MSREFTRFKDTPFFLNSDHLHHFDKNLIRGLSSIRQNMYRLLQNHNVYAVKLDNVTFDFLSLTEIVELLEG